MEASGSSPDLFTELSEWVDFPTKGTQEGRRGRRETYAWSKVDRTEIAKPN